MDTPIPEAGDPPPEAKGRPIWARVARLFLSYPRLTVMGMDETQSTVTVTEGTGRIAAVKAKHPHAYEPWSAVDDARLVAGFKSGLDFDTLGARFGRQPSAIKSRLQKIALEKLRTGVI